MERPESTDLLVWGRSFAQPACLLTSPTVLQVSFRVKEIACGDEHCLMLSTEGRLFAQGVNSHGALGIGAGNNVVVSVPVLIDKLRPKRIAACMCGAEHSLCLAESGELFTWGIGEHGVLGLGDCEDQAVPMPVRLPANFSPIAISAGARHSVLLCDHPSKPSMLVCGLNLQGQLGLGHFASQRTFVEMPMSEEAEQVACGLSHTLILTRKGTVYGTGANNLGQLGLGHRRPINIATRIHALSTEVLKVAAGSHSAALTAQSDLYVWGTGPFGTWLVPQKFSSTAVHDVDMQSHFGVAVDSEQCLWTWGSNTSGQLGLGDFRRRDGLTKTGLRGLRMVRLGGASVVAEQEERRPAEVRWQLPESPQDEVDVLRKTVTALECELRNSYKELSTRKFPDTWSGDPQFQQLEESLTQQFQLNDHLARSLSKLQISNEAQQQEMLSLARELEVKDQQSERLHSKYRRLKDAYSKLKVQNQHLLRNYKEELGYRDRLKTDLQGLETKLEQSLQSHLDYAQLQQTAATAQTENQQLRKDLALLSRDYHSLEQRFLSVLQESDSLKSELLRSLSLRPEDPRWASELEPIEESEGGTLPRRSSDRRYTSPLHTSVDFVNFGDTLGFPQADMSPLHDGNAEVKGKTEPPSLASSFPDKSAVQQPLSLRSSLSELSAKNKELKKSKTDVELRRVLLERKLKSQESGEE